MNASHHLRFAEDFDEPWRRLPWVILAALLSWILLLGGFAKLLERKPAPEAPPTTIEARIIENASPHRFAGRRLRWRDAGGAAAHRASRAQAGACGETQADSSCPQGQGGIGDYGTSLALRHRRARRASRTGGTCNCVEGTVGRSQ